MAHSPKNDAPATAMAFMNRRLIRPWVSAISQIQTLAPTNPTAPRNRRATLVLLRGTTPSAGASSLIAVLRAENEESSICLAPPTTACSRQGPAAEQDR